MKNDGYIAESLSPAQVDAIRQVKASLAIEGLSVSDSTLSMMKQITTGELSYDDAIADLKRKYQNDEPF
ncbi:MAG: antitoxin VbhA family protein [Lachnospiraceae bacterium]|nr:antitoxin VbhA family protein [Lachnospiraceae bacterium]